MRGDAIPLNDDDLYGPQQKLEEAYREAVVFRMSREWYALPVEHVREILPMSTVTPVPAASAPIIGIMSVRGNIVSVTDPRRRFGLEASEVTPQSRLILVESGSLMTGLPVDEVAEVARIPLSRFEPPFETLSPEQAAMIESTCHWQGHLTAMLKTQKIFERSGARPDQV